MPYAENERTIRTKVIGVAFKEPNDKESIRQAILKEMWENPENVDFLFLDGMKISVQFSDQNRQHDLGLIKDKYEHLIMNNPTIVQSWRVTGGHPIKKNDTFILGQPVSYPSTLKAHYGLNVSIKLL